MSIAGWILRDTRLQPLARALTDAVASDGFGHSDPHHVQQLRHFFRSGQPIRPESVYSSAHLDFTLRYGLANLVKIYYLLTELDHLGLLRHSLRIVDLGSGPGTLPLACLLWLNSRHHPRDDVVEITTVEPMSEFLRLFEAIWNRVDLAEKAKVQLRVINSRVGGALPFSCGDGDVILLSNSLTEMLRDPSVDADALLSSLVGTNGTIVVVDYPYRTTSTYLERFVSAIRPYYRKADLYGDGDQDALFQYVDLGSLSGDVGQEGQSRSGNTDRVRFVKAILIPVENTANAKASSSADIVLRYKAAWENHDIELLRGLFTEDALYWEKTPERPLEGLRSIRNYWLRNASEQRDVRFSPLYIDEHLGTLSAHWRCRFYRVDLSRWLGLRGTFDAKLEDGKIRCFQEAFKRHTSVECPW